MTDINYDIVSTYYIIYILFSSKLIDINMHYIKYIKTISIVKK